MDNEVNKVNICVVLKKKSIQLFYSTFTKIKKAATFEILADSTGSPAKDMSVETNKTSKYPLKVNKAAIDNKKARVNDEDCSA